MAGVVNIRGELHLCARLDRLFGAGGPGGADAPPERDRMIATRRDAEVWVFAADEVDQVHRVPGQALTPAPPTLSRAAARLTRGVFASNGRAVGLLDEDRLFQAIREQVR